MKQKFIITLLITLSSLIFSTTFAREKKCVSAGDVVTLVGTVGQEKPVIGCCSKLKTIGHPVDSENGAAPGRVICAPCGNKKCDTKFENRFNCPQDCKS